MNVIVLFCNLSLLDVAEKSTPDELKIFQVMGTQTKRASRFSLLDDG